MNKPELGQMAPKDCQTETKAPRPPKTNQTSDQPKYHQHSNSKQIGPPPYPPIAPQYINDLPKHIRPYLDQIINVKGDGHCGFRAAAYCLGQGEGKYMDIRAKIAKDLLEKQSYYNRQDPNLNVNETLKITNITDPGPCSQEHWMSMPSMGRPMANALKTAVFFYSNLWCESFFPDFDHPNGNPPIIFALVPSVSHFVAITFKDQSLFPVPRPVGTHGRPFSGAHQAWQAKYSRCIALYNSLNP
jgi:histone-lysine N-methyltransferase SETD2